MAKVLIIDDDEMICEMLSSMVGKLGHEAKWALTLKDGYDEAASGAFDVVFLDVRMPDGNGLAVLPKIRELPSAPEVIIITGAGGPDGAELAIRNGAWDYIGKQATIKEMTLPLVRALQYREEKKAVKQKPIALKLEGIVGSGPKMRACFDTLAQAAVSDAGVLILGETGTGKELFARAIQVNSPRAAKNFVVVDCAALPESLIESALFGHERGAFTGADRTQLGLIKQADGGTLFLDEVGELPVAMQKAFLRVLQEHRFRPIGGREQDSDFRLVSATNQDLEKMVEAGRFRRDLLFRLQGITLKLPPLRERREEIRELTLYHVDKLCKKFGIETKGFTPEFFAALAAYDWPGNVRELVNALDRALSETRFEPTLYPKHLPFHIRVQVTQAAAEALMEDRAEYKLGVATGEVLPAKEFPKLRDFREAAIVEAERQYLQELMTLVKGNIKEAARISGLSIPRLYALMSNHKISRQG